MGTRGIEILKVDVEKLIETLNKLLADEWLAYYQYWIGAKVVKGPMKDEIAAELVIHATEELGHAELLADRITQLGGDPLLNPKDWFSLSGCGYDAPVDPFITEVLKQNIKGEQCAISSYNALMEFTKDKDIVTYNMALSILQDELEHEQDLEDFYEDLSYIEGLRK
jgi:bacterioferritin